MRAFGVDFALFWAVVIGLFNYIPYVGSFVGVFFPVVLSLGQFGSLWLTLALCGALTAAQIAVGNFLDPWLVGRRVNLSPLVVIVSLVFWVSLWGLPGAILAVPLTSAVAIICAAFPASRPIAVLLSAGTDLDPVPATEPGE
jgi:predicted PurR-regulated permease PerM